MQHVGLQPARYIEAAAYRTILRYRGMKRHDISISLLGYDMITRPVDINLKFSFLTAHRLAVEVCDDLVFLLTFGSSRLNAHTCSTASQVLDSALAAMDVV